MKCPDCSKTLIDVATSCRCGWRLAVSLEAIRPSCKCGAPAILRRGDMNFCDACAIADTSEKARGSLEARGLQRLPNEPITEWRKRLLQWLKENASFKRFGAAR